MKDRVRKENPREEGGKNRERRNPERSEERTGKGETQRESDENA